VRGIYTYLLTIINYYTVILCIIGEVMQLNAIKGDTHSLFEQYIEKTFKKTASLMAYSCQAVSQSWNVCV